MIKLIVIILLLPGIVFAKDLNCAPEPTVAPTRLGQHMSEISEAQCAANKAEDHILDLATGCLSGGYGAVAGAVEGILALFKLLTIEIPKWMLEQQINTVKGLINGDFAP